MQQYFELLQSNLKCNLFTKYVSQDTLGDSCMSHRVHFHLYLLGLTGTEAAHVCIVLKSKQQQTLSLLQQVCRLFTDTARRLESLHQCTIDPSCIR